MQLFGHIELQAEEVRVLRNLCVTVLAGVAGLCAARLAPVNAERSCRVTVSCRGSTNTVTFADGRTLSAVVDSGTARDHVGLYAFHSYEFDSSRQSFHRVDIRLHDDPEQGHMPIHVVAPGREPNRLTLRGGWEHGPWSGLTHGGKAGDRAVLLVDDLRAEELDCELEIRNGSDAGLLLRAKSANTGLVFVMRPRHNDAFFFHLENGEPGRIVALTQLTELGAGSEALRLAGLLGSLAIRAVIFLVVLLVSIRIIPHRAPSARTTKLFASRAATCVLAAVIFAGTFVVLLSVCRNALHSMPHIADETAYLVQAKTFSHGRVWAPAPPLPEFFEHEHLIIRDGKWFSKYPPMLSALLALTHAVTGHWCLNPFLGAVMATGLFFLVRELTDTASALFAVMLTVSSPFFLLMGANLMTHMTAAACTALAMLFAAVGIRTRHKRWFAAVGGCIGVALLTRPYTAFLVTLPLVVLWAVAWFRCASSEHRFMIRATLAFAAGIYAFAIVYFPWNVMHCTPDAKIPINLYSDYNDGDELGFGPDKGKGWLMSWGSWGHTPAKAFRSVHGYLDHTSAYLFGWPGSLSLAFVLAPFLLGKRKWLYLLLLSFLLALILGHMLYWATQHIGYGARYWFSGFPAIVVLSAMGIRCLSAFPNGRRWQRGPTILLLCVIVGLVQWNVMTYLPLRFAEGYNYGNISPRLREQVAHKGLTNAVVFVQTEGLLYNDGMFMNDPFMENDLVFARDLGARNGELMAHFPGYRAYRWDKHALAPLKTETTQ